MKQLLDYIIPNIVNHPEDVQITEETTADGTTLTIDVNPEDMGRIIGKEGKVIKAIRQIARVIAIKKGTRVHIDIVDKNAPAGESPEASPQTLEEPSEESQPVE